MTVFPSPVDIEFFCSKEAKPIQKLWKPRFGDRLFAKRGSLHPICFHQVYLWKTEEIHEVAFIEEFTDTEEFKDLHPVRDVEAIAELERHYVWLPRLDQLIELLEERGWQVSSYPERITHKDAPTENGYIALVYKTLYPEYDEHGVIKLKNSRVAWAVRRTIALAKALLAVMEKEAQDGSPT